MWWMNLYNFMDGIDGFAAVEMLFMSMFFFVFAGASYSLLMLASLNSALGLAGILDARLCQLETKYLGG